MGETKPKASDGSLNGFWDGDTLPVPTKEKTDFTVLPCGGEGPRKFVENLRKPGSLDCNRKWSTLFGSNLKCKAIAPVPHKVDLKFGSCSISIPDCIVEKNMANLAPVLVGKFIGPRPNIEAVRDSVSRKWKGKGQIDVVAMSNGFFSFSFACEEDLRSFLAGGPWMLGKSSLALKKWELGFNPKEWECNEAPIWVRLPNLPMEF